MPSGRSATLPAVAGLPSGTVTFLFTDLEASTRLWREHPQTMKPALARHDAILRDVIAAHTDVAIRLRAALTAWQADVDAEAKRSAPTAAP